MAGLKRDQVIQVTGWSAVKVLSLTESNLYSVQSLICSSREI